MMDLPISEGCERMGVWFMNDTITEEEQNAINAKANKIFRDAQGEFDDFLKKNGYTWFNGIIGKSIDLMEKVSRNETLD